MKLLPLLGVASLTANVVLLALTVGSQNAPRVTSAAAISEAAKPATPLATAPNSASIALKPGQTVGAYLSEGSMADVRDRLLAAGVPPLTVQRIVATLVRERVAQKQAAMMARGDPSAYWQQASGIYDPARAQASAKIAREGTEELRALLGDDYPRSDGEQAQRKIRFGTLSADKIARLERIEGDYSEIQSEQLSGAMWGLTAGEQQKKALLEKEKRADIEALLTADELVDYDARNSPLASRLRNDLASFKPTEAEFRQLVQALRGTMFDSTEYATSYAFDASGRNPQRDEAIKKAQSALTAERFAEFAQTQDLQLSQENRLVSRLGLPLSTAKDLQKTRRETISALSRTATDKTLSSEAKEAKFNDVLAQSKQTLTSLLGADGYAAYESTVGKGTASMITSLRSRMSATKTSP